MEYMERKEMMRNYVPAIHTSRGAQREAGECPQNPEGILTCCGAQCKAGVCPQNPEGVLINGYGHTSIQALW
jgi:hypothetical protein